MHRIKINKIVALMISFFHLIGLWHRGAEPTVREFGIKLFYCVYYCIFVASFVVGAISNEREDTAIFLTEASIAAGVYAIKLWILVWRQNQIVDLLYRICEFSISCDHGYVFVNDKLRGFIRCVILFIIGLIIGFSIETVVSPFFANDKTLFYEIWFPLDWNNSDVAFWIATIFLFTGDFLMIAAAIFSILIWYLLLNCALRHEVLGNQLRNIGRTSRNGNRLLSEKQMHTNFFESLQESIIAHVHLRELTNELGSFLSALFFIQFGTSGLCICGSIYCLAFDLANNVLEQLMYLLLFLFFIAELFMITYFGNEITYSSNRLSYSLFESDWYNQPQSTKKCIIIFGEYLKKPHEFRVCNLYPLTLETFTMILNSAYSMFNILKNFKL